VPGDPAHDPYHDAPAYIAFTDAMRRERFDLALQMYGGGRYANPLLLRFNARLTVGMRTPDAAPLGRCLPFNGVLNRRLQLLEIAALAGAQSWPMTTAFHATNMDRDLAARLVPAGQGKHLVVIQPGATDPRRRWPAERFAAVADALVEEGATVAVNGTESEAALVRAVLEAMRHSAIDLSGKATLSALCGLLERSTLIVANDTGPLHLALEMGTPGVGIYWFTNMVESAPLSQRNHRAAVSLRVNCPVCGMANVMQRCEHDVSFVDDVPLGEVTALAIELYRASL
jgi:ADP-heptose:LPS heptosyltransferase